MENENFYVEKIQPKDIWVNLQCSLSGLKDLRDILNRVEVKYDSKKEPEMVHKVQRLHDFFNTIDAVVIDLEDKQ